MVKKQDEDKKPAEDKQEDKKPEDEAKKKQDDGVSEEPDRLSAIEEKVDKLAGLVNTAMGGKMAAKEDTEEKKPEDEEKKKQEDEDEDEEKKKEEGEPKPGQGEVKLPKATAGETDENTPKATDKITITEKQLTGMVEKSVKDVILKGIKSGDIVKTTTPRPITKSIDLKPKEDVDLAKQIIEKTKSGEWDAGKINLMIKKGLKAQKETMMQKFRDEFLNEGGA